MRPPDTRLPRRGPQGDATAADERDAITTCLDDTLIVEAAAGTGKTTALVGRIVRLVSTGRAAIEAIVGVTFSEKAAGELKLRLREELELARQQAVTPEESGRLQRAVERFEEAHVSTIHGFCADLLRERPVEARIDPSFQVMTEGQAARLFNEAFTDWVQQALDDPPEGVRRSLRRETASRFGRDAGEAGGPIERLERAGYELLAWRDHPAPWRRPDGFDRTGQIDDLLDALAAFHAMSRTPSSRSDLLFRRTVELRRVHEEVQHLRARELDDYDGWEARLCGLARMARDLSEGRSTSGQYSRTVPRQTVVEARDMLVDAIVAFRDRADADMAALLRDELQGAIALYEARKVRAGVVDFLDLLIRARDLVRDRADVRRDFQRRFRYLLVDEFQDTDPLQAELLLWLARDEGQDDPHGLGTRPGALFLVGDPKQSIYRFRRADVGIYRALGERLVAAGGRRVRLTTSFRSVPAIQCAVNTAFSRHMTGDAETLQADYVPLAEHRAAHEGQPAVVALPVPRPYGRRGVTATAITASLPDAVGAFVAWLVQESGWTVEENRRRRPIRAGDVCLLFRRFLDYRTDVTRPYLDALESRGVPHLLVGGKAFHEREEVDALRTALTAIEWPDDELSVFAALRGPLFAVGEEDLLAWHAQGYSFRPHALPDSPPAPLQAVADALALLAGLTRQRNHRPIADTIGRLLEATRAHAGFVLWRGGEQVLANVLQVAELARQYEAEGGLSFRGFVERLREASMHAPTPEAPILEEGTDGVRVMTVHKAKGLEFPVVVLADIGCRASRDEAQRFLDSSRGLAAVSLGGWSPLDLRENNAREAARDAAEGVRLAYVAATRARDLLVVPAVGDGPFERGWTHALSHAIYPAREPGAATVPPAFGLPAFAGRDTVLDRPDEMTAGPATVRPGAHAFVDAATAAPYHVVWWDPLLLERPGQERRGLRREDLITREARPDVVAADRARYDAWREWKASAIHRGTRLGLAVMSVSEWARAAEPPERVIDAAVEARLSARAAEVQVIDLGTPGLARPSGRRFGILVHGLVASVSLNADVREVEAAADVHARLLGATDAERDAAAAMVGGVLAHPILDKARQAEAAGRLCRRELPLTLSAGDVLLDGQADLAWDDGDGWVVVDFKTDVELAGAGEAYRRQVAVYAEAIGQATGRPVVSMILGL